MKQLPNGAVKRLLFSLLVASALSGCAVYQPAYPEYSAYPATTYYESYPDNSRMYAAPPLYTTPPVYVGPPVFFNFGFRSGHGHRHGGHHGFRSGGGWHGRR